MMARACSAAVAVALLGLAVVTLAAADPERGKTAFEKCAACHAIDKDTQSDGPRLQGVFGRQAGSRDDYRYSAAMQRSMVVWTDETLDAYLADPQAYLRGNRMSFAGMPDKQEREDLIAYLKIATK
jgi:cytochrome c